MTEKLHEKHCHWQVIVETCFNQKTRFSVTSTTNVRDLKLQCEVEFAIPAELQVLVHEKKDLDDTVTISSLPSTDRSDNTRTLRLHPISGLESFVSSCMKGDTKSIGKGIQDSLTNQLSNKEERAFVAAFIAAGSGKCVLFSSLLEDKECFVDIVSRRTKLSQRSLLHAAVAGGNLNCVMNIMTMAHGSLKLLHFEDTEHETPLDLARRLKKPALVELMEKDETIPKEEKAASSELSAREKTNLKAICLESTSLDELDLTLETKNAKQKDQVSGWISEASHLEIRGKPAQTSSQDLAKQDPNFVGMEKEVLDFNNDEHNETLDQRTVMESSTFVLNDVGELSETKQTKSSSTPKTQKEKRKTSLQKTKARFGKSPLKLRIPSRNKNKKKQQSIENEAASSGKTRANSIDRLTPKSASPSSGTVPEIKIIKNTESTRVEHVNSPAYTPERLSPTTENFMITQRPFSAHSHITGSPTMSRRLIHERPRCFTMEKDWCSSHSPPRASPPSGVYVPHPPDSPSSSRRRSWSPSPDLVAKLSPILQRKFGSACDLERPRSGSLKLNSTPKERQTPSPTTTTLPLVECKQFDAIRQNLPVQSLSAPTSPQSPRKQLPMKINQELEELHHRYFSARARGQSLTRRRGSLPGNLWKDNKDKDVNWKEHVDTRHKHGVPFEVWLREKQEQTARKREFESAAMKAVEKLADQTWSQILSQGKTYEQWRREKDQMKVQKNCHSECVEHAHQGECYRKALKFEEWLKKKDEEDLRREEERRQEAERHFEENRRKRETENEMKIAKLTKYEK